MESTLTGRDEDDQERWTWINICKLISHSLILSHLPDSIVEILPSR
jgi:hypothetical protein